MEVPQARYAQRDDGVSIAYQVVGDGPHDIVFVPGFISHLDLQWTDPGFSRFLRRLAGFSRVVLFDKPGTGLSDPIAHVPLLEERVADVRTVMEAAGLSRAALMGFSEGAATCVLFAATFPQLVESLVLYGGVYKGRPTGAELEAFGLNEQEVDERWAAIDAVVGAWGEGRSAEVFLPSAGAVHRRFWALFERAAASPRMARAVISSARQVDVLPAAPLVTAPALLVHRVDDVAPVGGSRLMARLMPHAKFVEQPGADHAFWVGDPDPVVDEIEQFVTGARRAAEPDRMLATVVFTDLVGSTQRAASLGDRDWRRCLEAHDAFVRREVAVHRGRVVKSMGDGYLSVFDGPARAIEFALALRDGSEELLRAGVHTGECEVIGDDLGGIAVHIGARVAALAHAGEVLVSGTVKDLVVGSSLGFSDRGSHELKGVPGTWQLFAAALPDAPTAPIPAERELARGDALALRLVRRAPVRRAAGLLGRSRR